MSPSGNDQNNGLSEAQPLKTIAAAQALAVAGDVIWLEPGATFEESIYIGPGWGDVGREGAPVVFSSSSTNRATVEVGPDEYAFFIYNAGHVTVENLVVVGPGMNRTKMQGLAAMSDDGRYSGITFRNLDVSGFNEGVVVWSWEDDGDGFDDVLLEQLHLHENLQGGGSFYGAGTASHQDVVVRCSEFAYNPGDPSVARPSGDGFVFGSVTNGLIDGCVAHHNGGNGTNSAGPVGLWAYNSSRITIQFSESYANLAMYQDGDGFDLDIGTTYSVIQYCYSHDNFGAGYLLSQQGAEPWNNNVLRYNISENDGWGGRLGAITYYSEESDLGLEDSWVYGNTVYSAVGPVLNLTSAPNASRNYLFNNIFVAAEGQMLVWDWSGTAPAGVVVAQGNLYWASGDTPDFQGYSSLEAWQGAMGQEMREGAPVGMFADPLLQDPGNGGTLDDVSMLGALDAYLLMAGSPAIDAALDPLSFVADPGGTDFFGTELPQGVGYDIGAHEWRRR
ncbi:MAG: right-handed parallel beta-helix repeat-containing protein [Deltaproteobacteria bacterium]|nr:right-handed parallel beta-helix repeat-containing protein [Deltaproteobacteria bacterium]